MKRKRNKVYALVLAAVMLFSFAGYMKAPEKIFAAVNPADIHTIEQVPFGWWAMQALVRLKTTPGTGSHAKLVMKTPTSAVSFGIQYDTMCGQADYRGVPAFMVENVLHNGGGGQQYQWFGAAERDQDILLMIVQKKTSGQFFLYANGNYVGTVSNPGMKKQEAKLSVEASARKGGDQVKAVFKRISFKYPKEVYSDSGKTPVVRKTNPGIKVNYKKYHIELGSTRDITIKGTLQLEAGLDWDSAYDRVSGAVDFTH